MWSSQEDTRRRAVNTRSTRCIRLLYGLKQAPRAWFSHIEAYFIKEGFKKCLNEQTLFIQ